MEKKKIVLMTIVIFVVGLIIAGSSYAFWSWNSSVNKNVVFNTANNLKNYIVYNEGESAFTGELNVSNNYQTGGIHSTISIYKTTNVNLLATIHMDINQIGENMKNSPALKWVVTEGTTSNVGAVLAKGNFIGTKNGDVLTLVPDINVTTTETFYTIWIWLDSSANPSDNLSGETLDTNVWTEINQVEGAEDRYEVTNTTANYQAISATVVDSKYKVTHYAVTTTNSEPTTWTTITPETDQAKVYNLNTTVNNTGTYYIWFKDESGRIKSKEVEVTTVDTSKPSCSWGAFTPVKVANGITSTVTLTCTDNESGISVHNLQTTDFTPSNNRITISNMTKEIVTNGYKYTITVTGTTNDGTSHLTLAENKVINGVNLGNNSTSSGDITVENIISVSDAVVTLEYTSTTYNGSAKTPSVTVTKNGTTLTKDTDYTVTYTNNTNVGTATVTITGINNYGGETSKTFTISYNSFNITLDNANATTNGTSTIYMRYADGVYLDNTYTTKMTTSANPITIPERTGYTFDGYYDGSTQMIDATGKITSAFTNTKYSTVKTLNAHWTPKTYTVELDENLFIGSSKTESGVTITYDQSNQYITLNGTPNSTSFEYGKLYDTTVSVGDVYQITLKKISGSYTTTVTPGFWFTFQKDAANYSNQTNEVHRQGLTLPTSGTVSTTITVTSPVSDADTLRYWFWHSTADATTFTNYKVQVLITKVETKSVTYNNAYGTLPTPTKAGYTFSGWYTDINGGTQVTSSSLVTNTSNHTLYAHWTANTYTVIANAGGGTIPTTSGWNLTSGSATATKTVPYNSAYDTLPTPTKTGYTFNGWYANLVKAVTLYDKTGVSSSGATVSSNNYIATKDLIPITPGKTLYSNISICGIYTYDASGNFIKRESSYTNVHPISSNAAYIKIEINKGDNDLTYYNNNLIISEYQYSNQIPYIQSQVISSTTNTMPANHTLYAKWTAKTYTVEYYQGNATSTAGSTKFSTTSACTFGTACTLKTYETGLSGVFPYGAADHDANSSHTNFSWEFSGWSTTQTGLTRTYEDGASINPTTYTATIKLYAVGQKTFHFYGGSNSTLISSQTQYWNPYQASTTYMTAITIPAKTNISTWSFCGYKAANSDATSSTCNSPTYAASLAGTSYTPTYNNYPYVRSVYSRTLTVSYNANGGSGTTSNTTLTQYFNSGLSTSNANISSNSITLATNNFTKTGYSFSKWAEGSASGTQYSAGAAYTGIGTSVTDTTVSKTMYAKWTANTYTLNANAMGGSIPATSGWTIDSGSATAYKTVTFDSTYGTLPTPTRTGHTFSKWTNTYNYGTITQTAASGANWQYFTAYSNIKPGVTYNITMTSATKTAGSATTFDTRAYDFTSSSTLALVNNALGSNINYTVTTPTTATRTNNLAIIIYAGVGGSTAGNSITFSDIKINSTVAAVNTTYTSSSTVKTPRNHDLVAQWTVNTYTITYNANGGSGAPSATTYTYASSGTTNLSSTKPTRTGYTFLGWSTSSTATSASYSAGQAWNLSNASNYTLYAVWQGNLVVTFNANGGSVSPSTKYVAYGDTYGTLPTPTRSGKTFTGWEITSRSWISNSSGLRQPAYDVGVRCASNGNCWDEVDDDSDDRGWSYANADWQFTLPAGKYRIILNFYEKITTNRDYCGLSIYSSSGSAIKHIRTEMYNVSYYETTFTLSSSTSLGVMIKGYNSIYRAEIYKVTDITSSTTVSTNSNHTVTAHWS